MAYRIDVTIKCRVRRGERFADPTLILQGCWWSTTRKHLRQQLSGFIEQKYSLDGGNIGCPPSHISHLACGMTNTTYLLFDLYSLKLETNQKSNITSTINQMIFQCILLDNSITDAVKGIQTTSINDESNNEFLILSLFSATKSGTSFPDKNNIPFAKKNTAPRINRISMEYLLIHKFDDSFINELKIFGLIIDETVITPRNNIANPADIFMTNPL